MTEHQSFRITFPSASGAAANQFAESLMLSLRESHRDAQVERTKPESDTMDFGATLILVLGAPATIAVARALRAWAVRNNASDITLETADGRIALRNL